MLLVLPVAEQLRIARSNKATVGRQWSASLCLSKGRITLGEIDLGTAEEAKCARELSCSGYQRVGGIHAHLDDDLALSEENAFSIYESMAKGLFTDCIHIEAVTNDEEMSVYLLPPRKSYYERKFRNFGKIVGYPPDYPLENMIEELRLVEILEGELYHAFYEFVEPDMEVAKMGVFQVGAKDLLFGPHTVLSAKHVPVGAYCFAGLEYCRLHYPAWLRKQLCEEGLMSI